MFQIFLRNRANFKKRKQSSLTNFEIKKAIIFSRKLIFKRPIAFLQALNGIENNFSMKQFSLLETNMFVNVSNSLKAFYFCTYVLTI